MSRREEKWLPGQSYTDQTDTGADEALLGEESLGVVRNAQSEWQKASEAGDQEGMDHWHGVAEAERKKAGYSGGANGGGYLQLETTPKEPDYGEASTEYKTAMDQAIQTLRGRSGFTYDPETDPSYQQYRDQYTRLGKQAMEDTYGNAALRTGGLGGSAAVSASQQAYNSYMQALADKIPELRQIAYQMYQDEEDRLRQDIDLYAGLDQQAWDRWNSERSFQRGAYESDRDYSHGAAVDQWNMGRQVAQDQAEAEETAYQREQDAKTWDWQERAYQDQRDDVAYERRLEEAATLAQTGNFSGYAELWGLTEEETNALVAQYAKEQKTTEEQAARDLADWYAGYGDYSKARELGVTPALAATKTTGNSSGGGGTASPETGTEISTATDIYQQMRDSEDPYGYLMLNYKALGVPYNQLTSFYRNYQTWEAAQPAEAALNDHEYQGAKNSMRYYLQNGQTAQAQALMDRLADRLSEEQAQTLLDIIEKYGGR